MDTNIATIMSIILICDCIINLFGFLILAAIELFSDFHVGDFLNHPFPKNMYDQTNLNWFGTIFMWILVFISVNIYFIIYYIGYMLYWLAEGVYKLFTIGRR